jgi:hypothetical protein
MVMSTTVKKQSMVLPLHLLICYLEINTSRKRSMEVLLVQPKEWEVTLLLVKENNVSLKLRLQLLLLRNALMKVQTAHVMVISFMDQP